MTQRADNDPEVLARTQALDALKAAERRAQQAVEAQQQAALDARQSAAAAQQQLNTLEQGGHERMASERRQVELRVFLYRLALTLPLLLLAGWLFAEKRQGTWWPFVWVSSFALFAFFVELVPHLPSYGGYVRYRRHWRDGAGGALRHRGTQPLPGAAKAGRGSYPTRSGAKN